MAYPPITRRDPLDDPSVYVAAMRATARAGERKRVITSAQPARRLLDSALNRISAARTDAGLPALTELERHFLRAVFSSPDLILAGLMEAGFMYPAPEPPQPEPGTPAEKTAGMVRDCERRAPTGSGGDAGGDCG